MNKKMTPQTPITVGHVGWSPDFKSTPRPLPQLRGLCPSDATACSPCCAVWPMFIGQFGWMRDPDGNRMMPYLSQQGSMWRINHCPSCGASVRDVIIPAENTPDQERKSPAS